MPRRSFHCHTHHHDDGHDDDDDDDDDDDGEDQEDNDDDDKLKNEYELVISAELTILASAQYVLATYYLGSFNPGSLLCHCLVREHSRWKTASTLTEHNRNMD